MPDICGIHRDLVNFMLKKQGGCKLNCVSKE